MKILLVEDDGPKRARVMASLVQVPGIQPGDISHAPDATSAKRMLLQERFAVLIVDLVLPSRGDQPPAPDGGAALVEELLGRPQYHKPHHIVALSAYDGAIASVSRQLGDCLVSTLKYDAAGSEWEAPLKRRIAHALEAGLQERSPASFEHDVAFVCALEEPELTAVLKLDWEWAPHVVPGDDAIYHRGQYLVAGRECSGIAVAAPRMGMPAAAATAMKVICTFRPRLLVMTGIAAGIRGKTEFGDVVVGDPCWDWGSGKWSGDQEESRFFPSPHQYGLNSRVKRIARLLARDAPRLSTLKNSWPGTKTSTELRIHVGPIASGSAVVASREMMDGVTDQHRKLMAVDMESYGVLAAAEEASLPRPTPLVIKAVADFGDDEKADDHQPYAAFTSAQVAHEIVVAWLAQACADGV